MDKRPKKVGKGKTVVEDSDSEDDVRPTKVRSSSRKEPSPSPERKEQAAVISEKPKDRESPRAKRLMMAIDSKSFQALLSGQIDPSALRALLQASQSSFGVSNEMVSEIVDEDHGEESPAQIAAAEKKRDLGPPVPRPTKKDNYIDPTACSIERCSNLLKANRLPPTDGTFKLILSANEITSQSKLLAEETFYHLRRSSRLCPWQIKSIRDSIPSKVWPLKTKADGNCLLYAIAKFIWGIDEWAPECNRVFRHLLVEELTTYKSFYLEAVDKRHEDEKTYSETEWKEFIHQASTNGSLLGFIHIFALSNIIRRPIYLFTNEMEMLNHGVHEEGIAGLFLPTRQGPSAVTGPPVALAWSDDLHNHFVPLILIDSVDFEWPLLDLCYRKTLQANEKNSDYVRYNFPASNAIPLAGLFDISRGISPGKRITIFDSNGTCAYSEVDFKKTITIDKVNYSIWINTEDSPEQIAATWWTTNFRRNIYGWHHAQARKYFEGLKKFVQQHQDYAKKCPYYSYPRYIPQITCSSVPIIKEFHKITVLNDQCLTHIKKTNESLVGSPLELSSQQVSSLTTLFGQLKSSADFNNQEFPKATLDMILKMIQWPQEKIFSVIDVVRVLILHQKAAQCYLNSTSFNNSLFMNLFKLLLSPTLPYANAFVLIKFIINLFHQDCLHAILLNHPSNILDAVSLLMSNNLESYDQKQRKSILGLIVQLLQNFAFLWIKQKSTDLIAHKSITKNCIALLLSMLHDYKDKINSPSPSPDQQADTEMIVGCLGTIATILVEDGYAFVDSNYMECWLGHPNQKVKDITSFILHLKDVKLEMQEMNHYHIKSL